MSDERDVTTLHKVFLGAFLAGGLLFAMISCATMRGLGEDVKKASGWLPDPYGDVADIGGTILLMLAGHKTVRHIRKKKRAARKAKGH